jgi:hypothetical protein
MSFEHSPVRLYIGFGGSGLKTILEFVETLTQHGEWAEEVDTRFAFILADTDRNDLAKYSARIQEQVRRIGKDPIVKTIRTSEGITNFQHYVASRLARADHHKRLREHWWYSGEVPFTAENLTGSPEDGAGQCPLVSTFLAWNILERMGKEVLDAVVELKRRITLEGAPQDWTIHPTIIAGLAGGTGRGCWHLLALKVREALFRAGHHTMPVGYFYDTSVFGEVMATSQGQANKMRINSLTGVSELAGWMRNETHRPSPVNFQVPSLDRPADDGADLIDVRRIIAGPRGEELRGVPGQSPLAQAFVVFAGGRAGRPGSAEGCYKVVANAMYARLVREVASRAINSAAFGGIGAASIEVPINELRTYVKGYVSKFVPALLSQRLAVSELDQCVTYLTSQLCTPTPFTYSPRSDGALLERILASVLASAGPQLRRLKEQMEQKEYTEAKRSVETLDSWATKPLSVSSIKTDAERQLVSLFWGTQAGRDTLGHGGLLRELGALDQLHGNEYAAIFGGGDGAIPRLNPVAEAFRRLLMRKNMTLRHKDGTSTQLDLTGFGTKAELAQKLADKLSEIAKALPGAPSGSNGEPALPTFEKARSGLLSRGIDAGEQSEINEAATRRVRMTSMGPIKEVLQVTLNQAADELKVLAREFGLVVTVLSDAADAAAKELTAPRDHLFWTAEDFKKVLSDSADSLFSARLLSEQRLEPVADDAALEEALKGQIQHGSNERFEAQLTQFQARLEEWVRAASTDTDPADRHRVLRRMADKAIHELADNLVLPRKFYVDRFGFFATVQGLLKEWGHEFRRRAGSDVDTARLKAAFRVRFGRDYPHDRLGPLELQGDELNALTVDTCAAMAVHLGNRCDVLFEARRGDAAVVQDDVVAVIAPAEERFNDSFKSVAETRAVEERLFRGRGSFALHPSFERHAFGNPFLMIAYAQENFPDWSKDEGIDRVESLGYHRDPGTTRWLEACEDPSGRSYFTSDEDALPNARESYGLGYVSRSFVANETLRSLRWKPWARAGAAAHDRHLAFVYDTVVFALMDEPHGALRDTLDQLLTDAGWAIPILMLRDPAGQPQDKKWQFTRCAFREHLGEWAANNPVFKAGDGYSSIGKLVDALSGERNEIVEAIAAEASHFLKSILPVHAEQLSADKAIKDMLRDVAVRIERARDQETGPMRDAFVAQYTQLLARIEFLASKTCAQLQEHYERRGRH